MWLWLFHCSEHWSFTSLILISEGRKREARWVYKSKRGHCGVYWLCPRNGERHHNRYPHGSTDSIKVLMLCSSCSGGIFLSLLMVDKTKSTGFVTQWMCSQWCFSLPLFFLCNSNTVEQVQKFSGSLLTLQDRWISSGLVAGLGACLPWEHIYTLITNLQLELYSIWTGSGPLQEPWGQVKMTSGCTSVCLQKQAEVGNNESACLLMILAD